jgi:hypothetical protein
MALAAASPYPVREGYADWDYMRHTDAPDELAAHVATRAGTGGDHRPVGRRRLLARLYGQTRLNIRCTTASAAAATGQPACML